MTFRTLLVIKALVCLVFGVNLLAAPARLFGLLGEPVSGAADEVRAPRSSGLRLPLPPHCGLYRRLLLAPVPTLLRSAQKQSPLLEGEGSSECSAGPVNQRSTAG
ncbi:MAG TPA: hypothetical protein PLE61_06285 [Vicinamibacterales bacterium]|nr:hypothetical protein [Vicinamibacterales bacterium]